MSGSPLAAIREAIEAAPPFTTSKVFDGRAVGTDGKPITGTWYLVIQAGEIEDRQERLAGHYLTEETTTVFQCVGSSPEQARGVVDDLDRVLRPRGQGITLQVSGRKNKPLRRTAVSAAQNIDDTPDLWWHTVEYTHRSDPA